MGYSALRATTGSMRVLVQAGIRVATAATTIRNPVTAVSVDARDHEEQRGGSGKHEQCRSYVAQHEPRQRLHDSAQVAPPRRRLGAAEEGGQLGSGCGDRCSRCEPPDQM